MPHPLDEFDELKLVPQEGQLDPGTEFLVDDGSLHGFTEEEAQQADNMQRQLTEERNQGLRAAQRCKVFAPSPHLVCGAILERFEQNGGPFSVMGFPLSGEILNPDGVGVRTEFMGGNIYWHPSTGAHFVAHAGMRIWERFGWESGVLGYPTSEAISTPVPTAFKQQFSDKDMYYTDIFGGAVWGDIKTRYDSLGGPSHIIGIPISGEIVSGERYRYTDFSNGTISWRDDRQTRVLYAATRNEWARQGREAGPLGFPLTDEQAVLPGIINRVPFEAGAILWSALFGAIYLPGEWESVWDFYKETVSPLGLPISWEDYGAEEQTLILDNGYVFAREGSFGVLSNNPSENLFDQSTDSEANLDSNHINTENSPQPDAAARAQGNREAYCEGLIKSDGYQKELSSYVLKDYRRTRINSLYEGLTIPIRKGHYSWSADQGFGWMKACKKHNLADLRIMGAVLKRGEDVRASAADQGAAKMRFDNTVCRYGQGCRRLQDVNILITFYPKPEERWHGSLSKAGPDDSAPVGVITAYCVGYNVCPDIVNGPRYSAEMG